VTAVRAAARPEPPAQRRLVDGRISLEFARDGNGRTYLARQYACYPFHVCKVQFHDADWPSLATLYAQSCSGGLYEDDQHRLELTVRSGAEAHFTTQASTIVHSMPVGRARHDMRITAETGAYLEYLPDPQILFPHSSFASMIRIAMASDATVLVSDSFMGHDPHGMGGLPESYESEIVIEDASGRKLAIDRLRLASHVFQERRPGIMGAFNAHGTLLMATRNPPAAALQTAGRVLDLDYREAAIGVSALPNSAGIVFRVLAQDGAALKHAMYACWGSARLALARAAPAVRRK
jgi:urease accessory protein